jgi:festuclavine dehydrogenase
MQPRTILLLGGTGKVASRITPLLSSDGHTILVASRSGSAPDLPNARGVKFDWLSQSTWAALFSSNPPISAVFLVAPPIMDLLPTMQPFIDLAVSHGVKRLVLLSASVIDVGDGLLMGQVSAYIAGLGVEYAILRPTWFMENFSEASHQGTIRDEDCIITATRNGKVPFVACDDIAAVAFHALTDKVASNSDHLIVGSQAFSYDEVCHPCYSLGIWANGM